MPQISLSLLGPPLVERDGTALKLDTRKTLALLIYLAVTHRGHRRDSLADLLWPNSGHAGGRKLLRGSLYMLRRDLGGSLLKADRDSIALDADFNVLVDVDRFRDHWPEIELPEAWKKVGGPPAAGSGPHGFPCPFPRT